MFYKPNYCCNCGEKIERIEWYPWTNRRFCELCQTDYQFDDWIKRIFPTLFLLFGIFGIGTYFQKNESAVDVTKPNVNGSLQNVREQPKNLKPNTLKTSKVDNKKTAESEKKVFEDQTETKQAVEPLKQSTASDVETKQVVIARSPQKSPKENVFYCGAETKKGTPCSRKVKGGGRCWQHVGREAMLSANELKVGIK